MTSPPPLPGSIWVVAWASVAGQLAVLVPAGVRDADASMLGSVLLSVLVIGWVSAGVVRARPVRLVVAWVVLVILLLVEILGVVGADGTDRWVVAASLLTTVASLAGLLAFRRTAWYAWQRTRPPVHEGASVVPLVAVAALVGVLGGLIDPDGRLPDNRVEVDVRVAGHR